MADADVEAKQDLREMYDQIADKSREQLTESESVRVPESKAAFYFIDRKIDEAMKYCVDRRDLQTLEIGCSFGNMTVPLSERFDAVTAVDLSAKSIDVARGRLARHGVENVAFVVDDAEELGQIEDEAFDVVFSFSAIRYCPHVDKAVAAIHRKLRPGGRAIVDFPNRYSPWHWLIKRVKGIEKHMHDHLYTRSEVIELFEDAGFKDVHAKYFLFTTRRLPGGLLPIFRLVDAVLERIPLVNAMAGIVMVRGTK